MLAPFFYEKSEVVGTDAAFLQKKRSRFQERRCLFDIQKLLCYND